MKKSVEEIPGKRDHGAVVLWATGCAEHVLPCFEERRPVASCR
ncbi:hypothetical protein [Streptosporangium sp. NPDC087985]